MFEYLKRAFWLGPRVPGLGRLPVNVLATLGFGILGFGHPAFWLLGAGLEAAYLAGVAFHPRFQRLVDIEKRRLASGEAEEGRQELIRRLDPDSRRRLAVLEEKSARIQEMARESQTGDYTLETGRDALDRLQWIYLKLLVARRHLQASRAQAGEADLKRKIADLELGLKAGGAPAALRDSQTATLKILRQRLENLERCEQGLTQVDTDLARIEAQVDLAQESATVREEAPP